MSEDNLYPDLSYLERINTAPSETEIMGISGLLAWLADRRAQLTDPEIREKMIHQGLAPARGILLTGLPGCGKTLSARAIGASCGLPLYSLDLASVIGSYIGQTERNLKEALSEAEQVSPCILWIDEIDKCFFRSSGLGIFTQQFICWLREREKCVFVVATANSVSGLQPELLRPRVFDEVFFFDLPDPEERKRFLSVRYRHYTGKTMSDGLLDQLTAVTDGFSGADLESALRDLGFYSVIHNGEVMPDQAVIDSVSAIKSLSQARPGMIEELRAWGRERAVPASGRPIGG